MKLNKLAWMVFQQGKTSEQLKEAARGKAARFLFWSAAALGLLLLDWRWAVLPAILAAVNGAQGLDASKLAPELEALENLLRKTSRG